MNRGHHFCKTSKITLSTHRAWSISKPINLLMQRPWGRELFPWEQWVVGVRRVGLDGVLTAPRAQVHIAVKARAAPIAFAGLG